MRGADNSMLTELGQRLISGSLSDATLQRATEATPDFAILPWVNVVKIGGQSIMDRGAAAVRPVVDEIVANLKRHKMILGTGAGTRARHVYSLAIDLGLPTGVLTVLGTAVAWQNAQLLQYLISQAQIPEYQVRWRWQPKNSFAFWDNRSTQHYAVIDYPPCHYKLERAGIMGDTPF